MRKSGDFLIGARTFLSDWSKFLTNWFWSNVFLNCIPFVLLVPIHFLTDESVDIWREYFIVAVLLTLSLCDKILSNESRLARGFLISCLIFSIFFYSYIIIPKYILFFANGRGIDVIVWSVIVVIFLILSILSSLTLSILERKKSKQDGIISKKESSIDQEFNAEYERVKNAIDSGQQTEKGLKT